MLFRIKRTYERNEKSKMKKIFFVLAACVCGGCISQIPSTNRQSIFIVHEKKTQPKTDITTTISFAKMHAYTHMKRES